MSKIKITVKLLTTKKNYNKWKTDAHDVLGLNRIRYTVAEPFNIRELVDDPYKQHQKSKQEEEHHKAFPV